MFTISEKAAHRIVLLVSQSPEKPYFRVSITGGGCAGLQYNFSFERLQEKDDVLIEKQTAQVIVDPVSLGFLQDAELHFEEDLMGASFFLKNPNATSSCGCGSSFSVF